MAEENSSKKRKTMKYPQFEMLNETDLHRKVIDFIRKYYPQAIIIPGLGELQHTSTMRIDAWQKGYKGGQPDILLANKSHEFIGLAIELKTPAGTGVVSDNQQIFLNRLEEAGYYVIISNDYDEILMTIVGYFQQPTLRTDTTHKIQQPLLIRCVSDVYRRFFKEGC
jgi:hypothetical protein